METYSMIDLYVALGKSNFMNDYISTKEIKNLINSVENENLITNNIQISKNDSINQTIEKYYKIEI